MRRHSALHLNMVLVISLLSNFAMAEADGMRQTPDAEMFLAMDRKIIDAFLVGDATGYSASMSSDFFLFQQGYRATKDYATGMVGAIDCTVASPLKLSSPQVTQVTNDAYVLSYRMDIQADCASGDISITLPSPVRAATLWVYKDHSWQIAYHGENPIVEPASDTSTGADSIAGTESSAGIVDTAPVSDHPTKGSLLESLMEVETAVWETWRAHDARALMNLTAEDIAFVNVFGDYFGNKADTIANWKGPFCDVHSFSLSNGEATQMAAGVAALTLTGRVQATCGGQRFSDMRVYATTVYVKEGENWRWAFGFNSP